MAKDTQVTQGGVHEEATLEGEEKPSLETLNITMDKRIDLALTIVFILMGVFMIKEARGFRSGKQPDWFTSRGFPILAGGLLILEGVALAAIRLITWSKLPGNCVPEEGQEDEKGYPVSWVRCMLVILLSFMWEWFLIPLGLLIVTPLYLILCLWVMGERSWVILIVFSIIFTLANWITFGPLLGIRFPLGPLTNFLYSLGLA
jgi:hypothetical protein